MQNECWETIFLLRNKPETEHKSTYLLLNLTAVNVEQCDFYQGLNSTHHRDKVFVSAQEGTADTILIVKE